MIARRPGSRAHLVADDTGDVEQLAEFGAREVHSSHRWDMVRNHGHGCHRRSELRVKVVDVKELFAADVSLLKPVAVAPWLFELALIAVTKAVAVLLPDDKLSVKFAAKAFCELIFISLAARLLLL